MDTLFMNQIVPVRGPWDRVVAAESAVNALGEDASYALLASPSRESGGQQGGFGEE